MKTLLEYIEESLLIEAEDEKSEDAESEDAESKENSNEEEGSHDTADEPQ